MIKLYTQTVCGACMTVQAILEGNGLVKDKHFEIINIDEDEKASDYINQNYMGIPVAEYKGTSAVGVQMDKLDQMIEAVKTKN